MSGDDRSRRRFLYLTGSATMVGLAGCGAGGPEATPTETETPTPTGTATPTPTETGSPTTGDDGQELGPVPAEYETATALGGTTRNPDSLSSKSAVNYQSTPRDDQRCSNCTFYIEDMNGDGLGACAIVEGMIEPSGWCASYAPHEE